MASFSKFNCFVANVANGVHNLGTDTLNVMLSNTAPAATNTVNGNIIEISAGNGYTAGGTTATITSSTQTSGLYKLLPTGSVTYTATGTVGPFRYAVLYDNTAGTSGNRPLIGWWDYGSSVTLNSGDSFSVELDTSNGILQLQ